MIYKDAHGKEYNSDEEAEAVIPKNTDYCYRYTGKSTERGTPEIEPCPFHQIIDEKPPQCNGFCHFCCHGDWADEGVGLLWDMVKYCGVGEASVEDEIPDEEK